MTAATSPNFGLLARHAIERARSPDSSPAGESTFAQLAVQARLAAQNEAFGLEALEVFVARNPHPATERALAETRQSAELLREIHEFFKLAIPFEATIRRLIAEGKL